MFAERPVPSLQLLLQPLALLNLYFNSERLHKHVNSIVVLGRKGNNDVCVLHGGFDEVIVRGLHKFAVLAQDIDDCAAALFDVARDASRKPDVIRRQHKDLKVHELSESVLKNGVDSLEDNDRRCFNQLDFLSPLVCRKVIARQVSIFALCQFIDLFECQVEVEGAGVVEVVLVGMVVFFLAGTLGRSLTKDLCRTSRARRARCSTRTARRSVCTAMSCHSQCLL